MSTISDREPLRVRLRAALVDAMKARDATAIAALRSALGAIDNAEAVDPSRAPAAEPGRIAGAVSGLRAGEVPRLELSEQRIADIVRAEVETRRAAADEYEALARPADAARLRAEAGVLLAHVSAG